MYAVFLSLSPLSNAERCLAGAPFEFDRFDEFFRMVSAVHEDGPRGVHGVHSVHGVHGVLGGVRCIVVESSQITFVRHKVDDLLRFAVFWNVFEVLAPINFPRVSHVT